MAFVFNFPDVGEGIHEGRVVEWLVAEGDAVAEDQAMLKVETDKAVVELPSPHTGTVLKLHVAADATIFVGDALVTIGSPDEELPEVEAAPAEAPKGSAPAPAGVEAGSSVAPAVAAKRPLATPRTRALARKLGVELSQIVGSGSGGRILDEDVQRAADGGGGLPATVPVVASGVVAATADGEVERVPISHLRKMIANAMRASKQNAAHVTHVDEADVTDLVAHYRRAKPVIEERTGVRFTLLPFFIKALVATLQKYPIFNASVDEEQQEILFKKYYNIGVAVDTPEGLIVPVIRDADRKDMVELAAEVADKAERIINQPELAIVGLHAIKERPEVVNGEIAIRKMMYLSISFDHRYIDGAEAARFMSDMVRLVSEPMVLMARL
jgi:pyruvate dehydrogenase E2 component (dihydrolipoamide acetyltransferase)